jgi:hypothetical protein
MKLKNSFKKRFRSEAALPRLFLTLQCPKALRKVTCRLHPPHEPLSVCMAHLPVRFRPVGTFRIVMTTAVAAVEKCRQRGDLTALYHLSSVLAFFHAAWFHADSSWTLRLDRTWNRSSPYLDLTDKNIFIHQYNIYE